MVVTKLDYYTEVAFFCVTYGSFHFMLTFVNSRQQLHAALAKALTSMTKIYTSGHFERMIFRSVSFPFIFQVCYPTLW